MKKSISKILVLSCFSSLTYALEKPTLSQICLQEKADGLKQLEEAFSPYIAKTQAAIKHINNLVSLYEEEKKQISKKYKYLKMNHDQTIPIPFNKLVYIRPVA